MALWWYAGFRIDSVQRDKNTLYFYDFDGNLLKQREYPSINAAKRVVREWMEYNRG